MPKHEIRCLTGIRGIAASYVLLYHYVGGAEVLGPVRSVSLHGYIAVDLFFVLSGFVMALTYSGRFMTTIRGADYAAFLGKRFCRIYPVYGCTILLMIVAVAASSGPAIPPFSLPTVAMNLLLVQSWGWPVGSIDGPGWSISTEVAAYLAFPLLVGLVLRGGAWRAAAASAVAAAALVWVATRSSEDFRQVWGGIDHRHGPLDAFGLSVHALVRCFSEFTLGLLAYRLTQSRLVMQVAARPAAANLMVLVVLGLLAVPRSDLLAVGSFVLLVTTLSAETSLASRVIGSPAIRWVGVISYSMYLMTHVVEAVARPELEGVLMRLGISHIYALSGAMLIPVAVIVSACTYYAVEQPGRACAEGFVAFGSNLANARHRRNPG